LGKASIVGPVSVHNTHNAAVSNRGINKRRVRFGTTASATAVTIATTIGVVTIYETVAVIVKTVTTSGSLLIRRCSNARSISDDQNGEAKNAK
jgi:hypothetical protein